MKEQTDNKLYDQLATDDQIERAVQALQAHNIQTIVVETGAQARDAVLSLIPEGAEVHTASSRTLEQIGLIAAIEESGCYQAIHPLVRKIDRVKQGREFRKLASSPEYMLGSVHAVTETGQVVVGSGGGSQIGPYAFGASKVIWVVGAQKLVPTLEDGMRRLQEYVYPLENERMQALVSRPAHLNQTLIVNGSLQPGRLTLVIVKEKLGF
ncbi:MAG TPA: LUD domain-containing protein [Anaerolineaceae bacterium]|nr:LUD domain-containing protein [Anaerolineaceae bacterium]